MPSAHMVFDIHTRQIHVKCWKPRGADSEAAGPWLIGEKDLTCSISRSSCWIISSSRAWKRFCEKRDGQAWFVFELTLWASLNRGKALNASARAAHVTISSGTEKATWNASQRLLTFSLQLWWCRLEIRRRRSQNTGQRERQMVTTKTIRFHVTFFHIEGLYSKKSTGDT